MNPRPLHWKEDSLPLGHQGGPCNATVIQKYIVKKSAAEIKWYTKKYLTQEKTVKEEERNEKTGNIEKPIAKWQM